MSTKIYVYDGSGYQDLSNVFRPYSGSTQAPVTQIYDAAGNDLNEVFDPLGSCTPLTYSTNLYTPGGKDLSQIFAPISCPGGGGAIIPTVGTNGPSFTSTFGTYTGIVFYIPLGNTNVSSSGQLANTIKFNRSVSAYVNLVGGGAGGGTSNIANTASGYNWIGSGGGGGGIAGFPFTFIANTTYNFNIGAGGLGGGSNNLVQSSGSPTYFYPNGNTTGSTIYVAQGGIVTAYGANTSLYQNSYGGSAAIQSGTAPVGWTGCGGGGGGSSVSYGSPGSFNNACTGGTGGSDDYTKANPGVNGSNSTGNNTSSFYGGTGGSSYFKTISTPFNTVSSMNVGGGGAGASAASGYYYPGYAGYGSGGASSTSSSKYYIQNANNNSWSEYTVSSTSSTVKGSTGIVGGYGAGGGGTYYSSSNTTVSTGGNGGNGCVIIYWNTADN